METNLVAAFLQAMGLIFVVLCSVAAVVFVALVLLFRWISRELHRTESAGPRRPRI
jgi:uncharacterized membrane protein